MEAGVAYAFQSDLPVWVVPEDEYAGLKVKRKIYRELVWPPPQQVYIFAAVYACAILVLS